MGQSNKNLAKTMIHVGLTVVLGFFLFGMVSCSSDDLEDLVADVVNVDVEAQAEFELDPVTVQKSSTLSVISAVQECGEPTTLQTLINEAQADIEDQFGYSLDNVDITDITVDYVDAAYTAVWTPSSITSISCTLTINDELSIDAQVSGTSSDWSALSLTQDQINTINGYLDNLSQPLTYCLSCSDDPDSYTIDYSIRIGVTIKGNI